LLFFKDLCYIPPHEDLRQEVVNWYHDTLTRGHPGHFKTLELIRRYYWWPGMTVFIKNYVAGCAICQQMKVNTHPTSPGLIPIKGQKDAKPFSQVTCDFITDLLESDGFDSLMVVVDHGSTEARRITHRPMERQKGSTRSLKSIFESSAPTTPERGNSSTPSWSSATIKRFTPQ